MLNMYTENHAQPRFAMPLVSALLFSLLASPLWAQVVSAEPPPTELWGPGRPSVLITQPSGVQARIDFLTEDRSLRFSWRWFDSSANALRATADQLVPLSYYPTSILRVDGQTILVGGAYKRGGSWNTLVEQRSFGTATPKPMLDPQTGLPSYTILIPLDGTVDEVFHSDTATAAHGFVCGMTRRLDDPHRLLIYFSGSRVIYDMDMTTHVGAVKYSPTAQSGAMHIPELGSPYVQMWAREHVTLGYVYGLVPTENSTGQAPLPWLLMFDTDKDGAVDNTQLVSGADWIGLDLWNAAHWR